MEEGFLTEEGLKGGRISLLSFFTKAQALNKPLFEDFKKYILGITSCNRNE